MLAVNKLFSFFLAVILFGQVEAASDKEETFKKISTYTAINWLQKKPKLLSSKNIVLLIDRKEDKSFTLDAVDISDIANPTYLTTVIQVKNGERIMDFNVTNDERILFVTLTDSLNVYNISSFSNITLEKTIPLHSANSLVLSPDNNLLFVSGCIQKISCSNITVFQLTPSPILLTQLESGGNTQLTISKDGTKLAFVSSITNTLVLAKISPSLGLSILDYDSTTYNNRGSWKTSGTIEDIAFSDNGKELYVAGNEVGLIIYNISTNQLHKIQQTGGIHWGVIFNSTNAIYSIDVVDNNLYLSGESNKQPRTISSIKSVDNTYLFSGEMIKVSPENSLVLYVNSHAKPYELVFLKLIK